METPTEQKSLEQKIQDEIMKDESEFLPGKKGEEKDLKIQSKINMRDDVDTYDEGEKDILYYDDEKLPLSVRERR